MNADECRGASKWDGTMFRCEAHGRDSYLCLRLERDAIAIKLEEARRRIEELEEAYDYAQNVYENFLRDTFPGEEGKTWLPGLTSRKFVEMVREHIEVVSLKNASLIDILNEVRGLVIPLAFQSDGDGRLAGEVLEVIERDRTEKKPDPGAAAQLVKDWMEQDAVHCERCGGGPCKGVETRAEDFEGAQDPKGGGRRLTGKPPTEPPFPAKTASGIVHCYTGHCAYNLNRACSCLCAKCVEAKAADH